MGFFLGHSKKYKPIVILLNVNKFMGILKIRKKSFKHAKKLDHLLIYAVTILARRMCSANLHYGYPNFFY